MAENLDDVTGLTFDGASKALDASRDLVNNVSVTARDWGNTAQDRYNEAADTASKITTDNPFSALGTVLLLAGGLGLITGIFLRRR